MEVESQHYVTVNQTEVICQIYGPVAVPSGERAQCSDWVGDSADPGVCLDAKRIFFAPAGNV